MSDAAAPSTATSAPVTSSAPAAPAAPSSAPASTSTPAANGPPPATSGEAAANGAPAPAAEWKRKVKIDGREVEVDSKELPAWFREAAGEEEALSTYRLRAAAQARMKEAAELRKQSEAITSRLKGEQMMDALLELHGGDQSAVDRFVEAHYAKRLRLSEMTPEQRELEQLRQERAESQRREQERVEHQRQQEAARLKEQYARQWQAEFPEAAKESKLPWSKPVAARMVQHARAALEAGEHVDAKAIARDVAAELREEWEAIHGSSDEDALLALIGEERMKKIRARDVERLKASQATASPPPAREPQPRADDGRFQSRGQPQQPTVSMREFFQRRRGL